jgi:hypothetical protein
VSTESVKRMDRASMSQLAQSGIVPSLERCSPRLLVARRRSPNTARTGRTVGIIGIR